MILPSPLHLPVGLSYWLSRRLPVDEKTKLEFLSINCPTKRLMLGLQILKVKEHILLSSSWLPLSYRIIRSYTAVNVVYSLHRSSTYSVCLLMVHLLLTSMKEVLYTRHWLSHSLTISRNQDVLRLRTLGSQGKRLYNCRWQALLVLLFPSVTSGLYSTAVDVEIIKDGVLMLWRKILCH